MATIDNTIIKEVLPFTFDDVYAGIAAKFAEKGYDSPYDGSNLAQLITSMAYTTSMLNANTAININETILTLARKRPNIVQDARLLGYESAKKVSYIYEIEIIFNETKLYTISKYDSFLANGITYYYMEDDLEVNAIAGDTLKIHVKQGELLRYVNYPTNLRQVVANLQYFDIPYTDVETNGIEVFVTNYTPEGVLTTKDKFKKSETLLIDVDDNMVKKFVRLEDNEMETPRVYFVLSGVGNALPKGALVEFNVLRSIGSLGEMTADPVPTRTDLGTTAGYKTLIVKGAEEESDKSIKDNAPLLHNTASRVVTANDYEVVSKKHPSCKEAFIFGGEDEHPKRLGNIFFTLTPESATRVFSNDSERTLFTLNDAENVENNYLLPADYVSETVNINGDILNPGVIDSIRVLNLPSLEYNVRNPNYIFMYFDITIVKYALATVKKDVRLTVFNVLDNYIKTLETFESEFFNSNVINLVDDYLTDITGLDMDVKFKMLIDSKSIANEDIPFACTNQDPTDNPYLANPMYETVKDNIINFYLDTPYEGVYGSILTPAPEIITTTAGGTFEIREDKTFTYTALSGYLGVDDVTYTVTDGIGQETRMLKFEVFALESVPNKNPGTINVIGETFSSSVFLVGSDRNLNLLNMPSIDTENFIDDKTLWVDYEAYQRVLKHDISEAFIEFKVMLGIKDDAASSEMVGTYTLYNDRKIYVKVKLFCKETDENGDMIGAPMPDFNQIDINKFSYIDNTDPAHPVTIQTPRYIDLKYPSNNFKTIRSSIFKLNSVKIK